jgi:hypothetical protein
MKRSLLASMVVALVFGTALFGSRPSVAAPPVDTGVAPLSWTVNC